MGKGGFSPFEMGFDALPGHPEQYCLVSGAEIHGYFPSEGGQGHPGQKRDEQESKAPFYQGC